MPLANRLLLDSSFSAVTAIVASRIHAWHLKFHDCGTIGLLHAS